MKTLMPFLIFMLLVVSGCEKNPLYDEKDQNEDKIDEIYSRFEKEHGRGGYLIRGPGQQPTLIDVTNIELTYANYKAAKDLTHAIKEFDKSSSVLSRWMLVLSVCMTLMTIFQLILMIRKKK